MFKFAYMFYLMFTEGWGMEILRTNHRNKDVERITEELLWKS